MQRPLQRMRWPELRRSPRRTRWCNVYINYRKLHNALPPCPSIPGPFDQQALDFHHGCSHRLMREILVAFVRVRDEGQKPKRYAAGKTIYFPNPDCTADWRSWTEENVDEWLQQVVGKRNVNKLDGVELDRIVVKRDFTGIRWTAAERQKIIRSLNAMINLYNGYFLSWVA